MVKAIEVKNIEKYYGNQKVLKNVSFSVEEGKIIAFLGSNGAGKTTALHIIVGAITDYSGSIEIFGKSNKNSQALKVVSFVPAENWNIPGMKVKYFLELSGSLTNSSSKDVKKDVRKIINTLGLEDVEKNYLRGLSSGQMRKVSIAQGLISKPKILILDEPAANLDPTARQEVYFIIKKLKELGVTILISTHILEDLETFADQIVFIKKGKILGQVEIKDFKNKKETFGEAFARWNSLSASNDENGKDGNKISSLDFDSLSFWKEKNGKST